MVHDSTNGMDNNDDSIIPSVTNNNMMMVHELTSDISSSSADQSLNANSADMMNPIYFKHINIDDSDENKLKVLATFFVDHIMNSLFTGLTFQRVLNEFILSRLNSASDRDNVRLNLRGFLLDISKT